MPGNQEDVTHNLALFINDVPVATAVENNEASDASSLHLIYRGVLEENSDLELRMMTQGSDAKVLVNHMQFGYREYD